MPTVVKVMKVPKGSPAPDGYTFVRSTRGGDIYNMKKEVMSVADLTAMFGSSASVSGSVPVYANAQAVDVAMTNASDSELDALADMMGSVKISAPSFSLGPSTFGKGRHRKTRRGRKGRKATRRH
jgi:hypothetical protein